MQITYLTAKHTKQSLSMNVVLIIQFSSVVIRVKESPVSTTPDYFFSYNKNSEDVM